MNKFFKNILIGLALAIGIAILYAAYLYTRQAELAKKSELTKLLGGASMNQEKPLRLATATKNYDCQIAGPLPDPNCTPGAVFKNIDKDQICVGGYSKTVRKVSTGLRKKILAEYGIKYPVSYGSYEIDHLIPLSLGGNNDPANLWPEAAEPFPGFKEKDVVESYLLQEVCAGRIALATAQAQIAKNWLAIYNNLDQKIINDLKNKFPSWAN